MMGVHLGWIALLVLASGGILVANTKWYLSDDFMEDPEHRRLIAAAQARAAEMDERAIAKLVETLLENNQSREDYWALVVLEERAVPALVAALADPRFLELELKYATLQVPNKLERVWERLEPFAPALAVEPLTKLGQHPHQSVRQLANRALGSIGKAACVEPLTIALRDSEHYVRSHALIGINRAIAGKRAEDAFLNGLFDGVAAVVEMDSVGGTDAPQILLKIDRDRATTFLTDPARFRPGHRNISSIISDLAKERVAVPGDRVVALLDELERQEKLNRTSYGYGLQLLAISGHPSAEARIERAMAFRDPNDFTPGYLQKLAADAYLLLHGIGDAYDVAISSWGPGEDAARMPEPLRNYATVQVLNNEVGNGGFDQCFFNSYGEDVEFALAGLEAIGAVHSAKIVREARALFGEEGPSRDRVERQQQLEMINERRLERLSEAFVEDPDHLHVLLVRYAVKHKQHFQR